MLTVKALMDILSGLPESAEIRIGDQLEAGPYDHLPVGGVWTNHQSADSPSVVRVILCGNVDEEDWYEEDVTLPVLWPTILAEPKAH